MEKRKMNLVDPELELVDPTPDIHALFVHFNDLLFEGSLAGVTVEWSPRMTLCAGLCRFRGLLAGCSIHLSKPLLSLRSRRDLVETLLHEMIHAYLFVTDKNREREDHGPKFLHHMNRINAQTGTKITVYHSFLDEVQHFRTHWWKCSGPCVKRPPYFGIVKRSMNRAPGPSDTWWADHQRTCGGSYTKIREPSPKKKPSKRKIEETENIPVGNKKITDFFHQGSGAASSSQSQPMATQSSQAGFSGTGHKLGGSGTNQMKGPQPKKVASSAKGRPAAEHPLLSLWNKKKTDGGNSSQMSNTRAAPSASSSKTSSTVTSADGKKIAFIDLGDD